MTLPTSGPLSLFQIAAEFGAPTPVSLFSLYRGGQYVPNIPVNQNVPTSGPISIFNFYGASTFSNFTEFNGPFESGAETAYFGSASLFLPGGPLPNNICWTIFSNTGSNETSPAFNSTTLSILNFCGSQSIESNSVWSRLLKIEVRSSTGTILGSYNKNQLVPYPNPIGSGNAYYIPMQSLGLLNGGLPTQPAWIGSLNSATPGTYDPVANSQIYLRWFFSS
jgi:hypothetical protein